MDNLSPETDAPADAARFTPAQAMAELTRIQRFQEEGVTRTSGLVWMVWGLAFSAALLAFGTVGGKWVLVSLFSPLVVAAVATAALWRAHAVHLDMPLRPVWSLAVLAAAAPLLSAVVWIFWLAILAILGIPIGLLTGFEASSLPADGTLLSGIGAWAILFGVGRWSGLGPSRKAAWVVGPALILLDLLRNYTGFLGQGDMSALAAIVLAAYSVAGAWVFKQG